MLHTLFLQRSPQSEIINYTIAEMNCMISFIEDLKLLH